MSKKKYVWIASLPRSGSNWVAHILETRRSLVISEPDNKTWNWIAHKEDIPYFTYRRPSVQDELLERFFSFVFSERLAVSRGTERIAYRFLPPFNAYPQQKPSGLKSAFNQLSTLNYKTRLFAPLGRALASVKPHLVVKSVYSSLLTEWLEKRFEIIPILLFRNPLDTAASWVTQDITYWGKRIRRLAKNAELVEDYLSPYKAKLQAIEHSFEQVGAFIGAHHFVAERWLEKYPHMHKLTHEDLCIAPEEKFAELFGWVGLKFDEETRRKIAASTQTQGSGYDVVRLSAEEPGKWKKVLTEEQAEQVVSGYSLFPNKTYSY